MALKLKILYAEDNRITAQETTEALEESGYEVETVFDGNEAWLAFQAGKPDVVVLDYQMPGKTGMDVFLLIRKMNKEIPVLILSSYTELCAAALKMGTSDFVRKDGGISELCARIEASIRNRTPQHEDKIGINDVFQLSPATSFHAGSFILFINGNSMPLSSMHGEVLHILCQNLNMRVSQNIFCKRLWNNNHPSKQKQLRDYISTLRNILSPDPTLNIYTSYRKGYCLEIH